MQDSAAVSTSGRLEDWGHTLFAESADAIFVVDREGRRLYDANAAALRLSGLTHKDLLATRFDHIFQWRENGQPKSETVHRPALLHVRKAGAIPVLASSIPLPAHRSRRCQLMVVRDARPLMALESGNKALMERIAELELENLQLRQSSASYCQPTPSWHISSGDLISGLAKQFNDWATVTLAGSTLVRSSINSTSPNQNFLKSIEEATTRAVRIIQSLLTALGRVPLHRQEVSLTRMFEKAMEEIELPPGITVQPNIPSTVGLIQADPELLPLSLRHIIQNSLEAMSGSGTLSFEAGVAHLDEVDLKDHGVDEEILPGQFVKIRIGDSGCGMSADLLEKVGKPFVSTKNDPKKPGLGLALAKGVCQRHGGWMELNSSPGKGTVVTLYLPNLKLAKSPAVNRLSPS